MRIKLLDGSGAIELKYLVQDRDRYGNFRIYFRRKGLPRKIPLKQRVGSAEFIAEYKLAFSGKTLDAAPQKLTQTRAASGSLRWLVERYYDESEYFSQLNDRTKYVRRLMRFVAKR